MPDYFYAQNEEPILKIENVSLKLDDKLILRDINFEIKDVIRPGKITGEIHSILAPSGTGKTQLFKLISGLHQPTTGTILVHGKPVKTGDVGVVAQSYPLFMHMSILDNLKIAAKKHQTYTPQEQKDKIEYYLEKIDLVDKKDQYPTLLSGGQRQRIAIIQQLLCSNGFLLLDEPFSGLDIKMVHQISELILEISNLDELNTIILVTHDYFSAAALSENLWFLGFDYDEKKQKIPGARIKFEENLMDKGFTWRYPEILDDPSFNDYMKSIREVFNQL